MLPSGLPEFVADDETLVRFLTSSGHYSAKQARPSAFMPDPRDRRKSVFRYHSPADGELWALADSKLSPEHPAKAAAVVKAGEVRAAKIEIEASEPPPRHADLVGWPWIENDPEKQRAEQKERALKIAQKARLSVR
jgi:hypothetical protein